MCKNEAETTALTPEDKVPVFAFFSSYIQRAYGSSYADIYYDFDKAGQTWYQGQSFQLSSDY